MFSSWSGSGYPSLAGVPLKWCCILLLASHQGYLVLFCSVTNDAHFEPLIKVASDKLFHCRQSLLFLLYFIKLLLRDTWELCNCSISHRMFNFFTYLFVSMDVLSSFIQWIRIHYHDYLFDAQIVLNVARGRALHWLLSFGVLPSFLVFFFIVFWAQQVF